MRTVLASVAIACVLAVTGWIAFVDSQAIAQRQAVLGNHLTNESMPMPTFVDVIALTTTNQDYGVPTGAGYLKFNATGDFYVKEGGSAAIPTSNTVGGGGSFLNPDVVIPVHNTIGVAGTSGEILTIGVYR